MIKIDTIVCITSDDEVFIEPLIKSLLPISDNILFLYTDYFLGGEPQDKEILNKIKSYKNIYKSLHFLKYEIDFNQQSKYLNGPKGISWKRYWISKARKEGMEYLKTTKGSDWFLILDSDEFPDAKLFNEWIKENEEILSNPDKSEIMSINFSNYVYYWKPTYQALEYEDSIIMVNPKILEKKYEDILINEWERTAYHKFFLPENKILCVKNKDNLPMFHHYSWVREAEMSLKKIKNWGHSDDHLEISIKYIDPMDINNIIELEMKKLELNYYIYNYIGYNLFMKDKAEEYYKYYLIYNSDDCEIRLKENSKNVENPLIKSFKIYMNEATLENTERLPICNKKLKQVKNKFNIPINIENL